MRIRPFVALVSILVSASWAARYHVSPSGDDTRSPLDASSPQTPWRTLERLDSVILYPGDSILLRRGDTLRGRLKPRLKADISWPTPVVVTGYGSSSRRPVVSGTTSLGTWQPDPSRSGVWRLDFPGSTAVARLFLDGRTIPAARYPATGWLLMRQPEGDSAFALPGLPAGSWSGAIAHIKSTPWNIDARRVVAMAGPRISLAAKAFANLREGWGAFLTGVPEALVADGRWVQDSSGNALLWRPLPGQDPSKVIVEASIRPVGIDLFGKHDVLVADIEVFGQMDMGIDARGTQRVGLQRCQATGVDQWGIQISGTGARVEDCRAIRSSTGGIGVLGRSAQVIRDTAEHIGDTLDLGPRGHGGVCCGGRGIETGGDSLVARDNFVRWSGWSGLTFRGVGLRIEGNHIDSALQVSNDGGGLYSFGSAWGVNGPGTLVLGNLVTATGGNVQGIASSFPRIGVGLYFDNMVEGLRATGNALLGGSWGVLVHNNRDLTIAGNRIAADSAGVVVSRDALTPDDAWGNRIDSNEILAIHPGTPFRESSTADNHGFVVATFRANLSCLDHPLESLCRRDSILLWSKPRGVLPARATLPERFPPLASGIQGWRGWPSSVTVQRLDGVATDSLGFRVRYPGDSEVGYGLLLRDRGVPIDSGELSLLRFRARGASHGMRVQVNALQAHAPYRVSSPSVVLDLDTVWTEFGIPFRSTFRDTSVRVDFRLRPADSLVDIAGISWRGIDTSGMGSLRFSKVIWNPDTVPAVYTLGSGTWLSLRGSPLPTEGILPPRSGLQALLDALPGSTSHRSPARAGISVHVRSGALVIRTPEGATHLAIEARTLDGRLVTHRATDTPDGSAELVLPRGLRRKILFVRVRGSTGAPPWSTRVFVP